jgi:predicted ATPase/class 3 adenylate cyclase
MTDIEGSTALWEEMGNAFPRVLASHHALLRRLFRQHGGHELKELGDGFLVVFQGASDALACAIALQRALADCGSGKAAVTSSEGGSPSPNPQVRVRVSLNTGEAQPEQGEYRTLALHLAQRLLAAGHGGQILCSEATTTLLRRDLEPGARLLDLGDYLLPGLSEPQRLFQVAYPGMEPEQFPPLRAEARRAGHLPPGFTRFFGRERERAQLEKLLGAEEARLVTLMGPGGSGKTRLALEVARQLVQEWRGAIWFVPLADLHEAKRIPEAIGQALQLAPSAGEEPLEQVAAALGEEPALLLLDNLEHLLPEGASRVQALIERVPALTCLATSRRRLNLSGERVFFVSPLPVPADEEMRRWGGEEVKPHAGDDHPLTPSPPHLLLEVPSVQLFVDRAQAIRPEFVLTEGNAAAVAALCRRLEGLPLALELAAARAAVLTPEQMLAQLERGLGVLASRQADAAARHRSLRGALEWSYRLLDPTLQRFFVGLSVFQGGWSLEAAEAVSGEPLALDFLEQLRECSLVLAEAALNGPAGDVEMRFRLLEALREYGREQQGEEERAGWERRHAEHFLAWAEQASKELLQGRDQQAWLERLEVEHDNLRAALDWAIERGEATIGLRLAVALEVFWKRRSYLTEARERFAAVLALSDPSEPGEGAAGTGGRASPTLRAGTRAEGFTSSAPAPGASSPLGLLRARALLNAGVLAWRQGDYGPARTLLEESLLLQRSLDNPGGVAAALSTLGAVAFSQGDFDASREFGAQALAIARELGPPRSIAVELHNLANVARARCDYATASSLYTESLAISRELGDRYDVAYCLHGLGLVGYCQGDWGSTRGYWEECLAIRREVGDRVGTSMALYTLGVLSRDQGDYGAARACFEESLALRRELGDKRGIALSLYGQGTLASEQGDAAAAQSLLEESVAMFRKGGDRHMAANASADLGALLSRRGEYAAARPLLEESLAIYRETGDRRGIGTVCYYMGSLALAEGGADAAGACYKESLAAFRQVGERYGMARALEGLARMASARDEPKRAAQLYAAAAALREALGAPVAPIDQADYESQMAALRACLGEEGFTAAWAEGQVMPLNEAVAFALGDHATSLEPEQRTVQAL